MNINLINLQRNSKATCVVIKNEDYNKLSPYVSIKAKVSDNFLFSTTFSQKIDEKSEKSEVSYFIIQNIDEVSEELQARFIGLVKDREINGYALPDNCIIVFTVKDEEGLKSIIPQLYHFVVVAF